MYLLHAIVDFKINAEPAKALVLNKEIKFEYNMYDNLVIGTDRERTFLDCMYLYKPNGEDTSSTEQFYSLKLENGQKIICDSLLQRGDYKKAAEILGYKLMLGNLNTLDFLRWKYFDFTSCYVDRNKIRELVESYTGKTYGYDEYKKIVENM